MNALMCTAVLDTDLVIVCMLRSEQVCGISQVCQFTGTSDDSAVLCAWQRPRSVM